MRGVLKISRKRRSTKDARGRCRGKNVDGGSSETGVRSVDFGGTPSEDTSYEQKKSEKRIIGLAF